MSTTQAARYARYSRLRVSYPEPGILEIVMALKPGQKLPTADGTTHGEMTEIWRDFNQDPEAKVAIIRGEGSGFSAGGDLALVDEMSRDFEIRARVWRRVTS